MHSRRHQAGDMGHIHHQIRSRFIRDLTEFPEVDNAGIGAGACNDQLRMILQGDPADFFVIDHAVVVHAVGNHVKISAGKVGRTSVCQMSSMGQVHAHHRIPRFQHGEEYRHIGLRSGMGLHIGVLTAEQFFRPVNGKLLHFVHTDAAAVKSLSRITFCIFIGKRASHGRHHRLAHPVLGSDQLDMGILALYFSLDQIGDFAVHLLDFL